jgi:3-isopropylmalate/(R)-2-methylmalate dehydratase small subunit
MIIHGRARVFGDDLNTDYIISSSRKRQTIDANVLKAFLFESVAPGFAASIQPGDIVVAGRNFGCGSAMEVAVTVLQAAGIGAVLARSFARSFYRNAINNGLLVVECDSSGMAEGDDLSVSLAGASISVRNLTRDFTIAGSPLPATVVRILEHGGLIPYLAANGGFR